MAITWLGDVLRAEGCQVVEESGWQSAGRPGSFAPIGVLWHHTAATSSPSNAAPSLSVVKNGRSDLPGPLCHALIDYNGVFRLVAAGRANHAGSTRVSGPIPEGDGNTLLVGWEIDYQGVNQSITSAQYAAAVKGTAAVLRRLGRSADYARGHRETSTTGKPDPGFVDLDQMRADVAAALNGSTLHSSPSAVVDPGTGRNVFYVAADGTVHQYTVNAAGNGWNDFQLGTTKVLPGTSPSAVVDPTTGRNVFFVATDGKLHQYSVRNGAWSDFNLGGNVKPGTSPSAVYDRQTGRNVFFVASNGRINQYTPNAAGTGWDLFQLGGSGAIAVADGTSPSAVVDPSTGRNVFFHAADGKVHQYSVKSGAWSDFNLQGNFKPQTSPSAVVDPATGRNVFFVASNGRVNQYTPNAAGTGWDLFQLGGSGAPAVADRTSPSAVVDSTTGRNVFFVAADGRMHQFSVKSGAWSDYDLQGNVFPRSSPSAVVDSATGRNVFFVASNGRINQYTTNAAGTGWNSFQLGDTPTQ